MQFAVGKGLPSIVDVDVWTRFAALVYPLLFYGPINRELVQNAAASIDKILRGLVRATCRSSGLADLN